MPFPDYNIGIETGDGLINDSLLHAQIVAGGPYSAIFDGVLTRRDLNLVTTLFRGAIPGSEQIIVTGIVAVHLGATLSPFMGGLFGGTVTNPVRALGVAFQPNLNRHVQRKESSKDGELQDEQMADLRPIELVFMNPVRQEGLK